MVYSVTKYRHYLLGRKFSFHVDHSTLVYLVSKASLTGKIARWTLLLHKFEFDIYHRLGVQHMEANYLRRLESSEAGDRVRDEFPDAELFRVTTEPVKRTTCGSNRKPNTENRFHGKLELNHTRERQRERVNTKLNSNNNNTQSVNSVHRMCSLSTFIQVHTD